MAFMSHLRHVVSLLHPRNWSVSPPLLCDWAASLILPRNQAASPSLLCDQSESLIHLHDRVESPPHLRDWRHQRLLTTIIPVPVGPRIFPIFTPRSRLNVQFKGYVLYSRLVLINLFPIHAVSLQSHLLWEGWDKGL